MDNAMKSLKDDIHDGLLQAVAGVAEDIVKDMKATLKANDHIDTGALYESIRHDTSEDVDGVTSYIIADAQNEKNGAYYAEFLELGTGAAHGRPGGRIGTWRYQDRYGEWHTTDGMDADPFIEPSLQRHIGRLGDAVEDVLYDVAKYARTVKL